MSYPIFAHMGFKIMCTSMFLYNINYIHVSTAQRNIMISLLENLNKK